MDDLAQLLDALERGDQEAWEHLYRNYLKQLRPRLGQHFRTLPPEEVDDIWAIAIERIYQKVGTVRDPKKLRGWLWTVARNTGSTYLKRKRTHLPIVEEILADEDKEPLAVEGLAEGDAEITARLREAFEVLPPLHRTVLALRRDDTPSEVICGLTGLTHAQQKGVLGNVRLRFRSEGATIPEK